MKIVELLNKVHVPLTNEEADVLGQFHENEIIAREDFGPRQLMIANHLVNKDVLLRKNENGKITYKKRI
jgi:hypothetical protein